jgi:hypothetical protein
MSIVTVVNDGLPPVVVRLPTARKTKHISDYIRGMKRIFYTGLFPEWEEQKASLLQHADPHIMMMEALPEYDDIAFDEDTYDITWSILSRGTLEPSSRV